jgi:hypothetical protein
MIGWMVACWTLAFHNESYQRINFPIRTNTQKFCLSRAVHYHADFITPEPDKSLVPDDFAYPEPMSPRGERFLAKLDRNSVYCPYFVNNLVVSRL